MCEDLYDDNQKQKQKQKYVQRRTFQYTMS